MSANAPSLEERQAITRLKQGDIDGMEILVKAYQVQAVHAAYLILRDLKLAEDVVQNSFLNAAQKISQFDEQRPFAPWFMRSVINASIKAAKKQQRFVSLDDECDEESSPMVGWLLDPNPGPDQVVESHEIRRQVWDALAQLGAEQRAVLVMRHFLEMSESEMTYQLDRPLTTVRWWLRTARKRMRDLLYPFWQAGNSDESEKSG